MGGFKCEIFNRHLDNNLWEVPPKKLIFKVCPDGKVKYLLMKPVISLKIVLEFDEWRVFQYFMSASNLILPTS